MALLLRLVKNTFTDIQLVRFLNNISGHFHPPFSHTRFLIRHKHPQVHILLVHFMLHILRILNKQRMLISSQIALSSSLHHITVCTYQVSQLRLLLDLIFPFHHGLNSCPYLHRHLPNPNQVHLTLQPVKSELILAWTQPPLDLLDSDYLSDLRPDPIAHIDPDWSHGVLVVDLFDVEVC